MNIFPSPGSHFEIGATSSTIIFVMGRRGYWFRQCIWVTLVLSIIYLFDFYFFLKKMLGSGTYHKNVLYTTRQKTIPTFVMNMT